MTTTTPDRRSLAEVAAAAASQTPRECSHCGCRDVRVVDGRTVCRCCGKPVFVIREPSR